MSHTNNILVLGAGELGLSVIRGLTSNGNFLQQRSSVTVVVRESSLNSTDPIKSKEVSYIRGLGVRLISGDLVGSTVNELAELFLSYTTIINCCGFIGGKGLQLKLSQAVLNSGTFLYIPWQFGADYDVIGRGSAQDLFDEQLDVRDLLRSQHATEWVIISTGMFTSFIFEPFFGVVDLSQNAINALGSWDTEITLTTAEDIGNLTAEILFTEPRIVNQVVYLAGDTVSYGQLVDKLDSILGRTLVRNEWSVSRLAAELAAEPNNPICKYRSVFAAGKGVAWPKEGTFNAERGIETMDVERYIRENLKDK